MGVDRKAFGRILYAGSAVGFFCLALATRKFRTYFPQFVAEYGGDTFWPIMVCCALRVVFLRAASLSIALFVLGLAYVVEFTQLIKTPWLDSLRTTFVGGLILGRGFLVSDLICYAVGVSLFLGVDRLISPGSAGGDTDDLVTYSGRGG